jgi:hypothetical protein
MRRATAIAAGVPTRSMSCAYQVLTDSAVARRMSRRPAAAGSALWTVYPVGQAGAVTVTGEAVSKVVLGGMPASRAATR